MLTAYEIIDLLEKRKCQVPGQYYIGYIYAIDLIKHEIQNREIEERELDRKHEAFLEMLEEDREKSDE